MTTDTRPRRFSTVEEFATPQNSCAYFGDRGGWFMVSGQHRESDSLTRSNFAVLLVRLAKVDPDGSGHVVERFSCSMVGWRDHLLVDPNCRPALRVAVHAARKIDVYPVLDEDHWCKLGWNETHEWRGSESEDFRREVCEECGVDPAAARLDYIPSSDEFENADLIFDYLRDC